ncbi:MAG: thioredoxin domain-containing protein [Halobacteriota archaeon]
MSRTRRAYLAAAAGVATGGLAGCLGTFTGGGRRCEISDEPVVEELPPPVLGDPDADLTVMAFEDFACVHCRTYSLEVFPTIREEYVDTGDIRYEHHDFPIPVNRRWSWRAPSAARGVQDSMDDETFFEFAHDLFENQSDYSMNLITDLADGVGADGCAIRADAENETYRPVIETDQQLATSLGAGGTPAIYVGNQPVRPTVPDIRAAIDARL